MIANEAKKTMFKWSNFLIVLAGHWWSTLFRSPVSWPTLSTPVPLSFHSQLSNFIFDPGLTKVSIGHQQMEQSGSALASNHHEQKWTMEQSGNHWPSSKYIYKLYSKLPSLVHPRNFLNQDGYQLQSIRPSSKRS